MRELIGRVSDSLVKTPASASRSDVLKSLAILSAAFPRQMPVETAKVWATDIEGMHATAVDVLQGCRQLARDADAPTLSRLIRCIRNKANANDCDPMPGFGAWRDSYLTQVEPIATSCRHAERPGQVCGACGG